MKTMDEELRRLQALNQLLDRTIETLKVERSELQAQLELDLQRAGDGHMDQGAFQLFTARLASRNLCDVGIRLLTASAEAPRTVPIRIAALEK